MKSDLQLVRELKAKQVDAMGELYNRYFDKVYHKCLSITKNAADAYDCANDALLISFEKIESFKEQSEYTTWLFAITTNYCISHCRQSQRTVDFTTTLGRHSIAPPVEFELVPQKELSELLDELLASISSDDKNLLLEKYSHRRSIEELQEKYGMGASAIKMRLARAKQKVQSLYQTNLAISA